MIERNKEFVTNKEQKEHNDIRGRIRMDKSKNEYVAY